MHRTVRHSAPFARWIQNARSTNTGTVLGYLGLSVVWITLADIWLMQLDLPHGQRMIACTVKDILFVSFTAISLYLLLAHRTRLLAAAQAELRDQDEMLRSAYVGVLDAVTGGRLSLVPHDRMELLLGAHARHVLEVESPAGASAARRAVRELLVEAMGDTDALDAAIAAVSEGINNALVHGGAAKVRLYALPGLAQVRIDDEGPGIDLHTIPHAALVNGFSTTETAGMGFTIMLQASDRLLLATSPGRTTLVLEFAAQHAERLLTVTERIPEPQAAHGSRAAGSARPVTAYEY